MGSCQDDVAKYGGVNKAASALGIPSSTFKSRLKKEKAEENKSPLNNKLISNNKLIPLSHNFIKILYFTDAHNQPGMSLDRFRWLCALANEQKPDIIIDGGDTDDMPSLSNHEKNETYKGRLKPLLAADLEQSAQLAKVFKDNLIHVCPKIRTSGNHEYRINTYENNNPAIYGIVSNIYNDIWNSCGWALYPYGEYVDVAGVNFTHVPFDQNGKPVAGENACKKVAEKSQKDTVFGHIHYETIIRAHKFGTDNSVTCISAACFMPDGHRPDYVKNTRKEYTYGVYIFMVKDGRIKSIKCYSMDELEDLYEKKI